eukprot:2096626-Prymnesium_polylepis.1
MSAGAASCAREGRDGGVWERCVPLRTRRIGIQRRQAHGTRRPLAGHVRAARRAAVGGGRRAGSGED